MTRRKAMTAVRRLKIFAHHAGICEFCKFPIDGVRERWEVSHTIPLEMGGTEDIENTLPAHYKCHREQTSTEDAPRIAKTKRQEASYKGARGRGTGFRPKPPGMKYNWSAGRYEQS